LIFGKDEGEMRKRWGKDGEERMKKGGRDREKRKKRCGLRIGIKIKMLKFHKYFKGN